MNTKILQIIRNNIMTLFTSILLFSTSVSLVGAKDCFGTNNKLSLQQDRETHYIKLRERYQNCTVVRGNLEITGVEISDVEFFKDIEVVTGYVIIALNHNSHFPLEKLKIIRGQELYKGQYALYVAVNNKQSNILPNGLTELRFKSLTEIQRGSVFLKQNKRLCFAESINWLDILNPKERRRNKWNVTILVDRPEFDEEAMCGKCDPSCKGGCWGKGPDMCQRLTLNCSRSCGDSRCRGPGPDDCCDSECAAGCTGPTYRDCVVCRHVNNSGVCELSCPPTTLYDQLEARVVPNPDFKYHYHDQCVDTCPINLLVEENSCVKSCRQGRRNNGNGECVPCLDANCGKECYGIGNRAGELGDAETVDYSNIESFENCTIIQGNIIFQGYAFKGDEYNGISPLSAEKLIKSFQSVRVITGYLAIMSWPENLTDFSAFSNLEEIQGVDLYRDVVALLIQDSINKEGPFNLAHIESLGFRSLRSIKHGNVYMGYLMKLCYAKQINWKSVIEHPKPYTTFAESGALFRHLPVTSECPKCHASCSLDGCWGPSEFDCLACKYFTYGKECLKTCSKDRGVYTDIVDMTCKSCHEECNGTCIGPGEANCTSCRHYEEDGVCVLACPNDKYPDPETGICMPCHEDCFSIEPEPLCSGPNNTFGLNGCESCHTVKVDRNLHVQHCLSQLEPCPEAYFESEGMRQTIRSCVPCYEGCLNCTGSRAEQCNHMLPGENAELLTTIIVTTIAVFLIVLVITFIVLRRKEMKKRRASSMRALGLDSQNPDGQSMNPKGCLMEPMTPSGVPPNQAQLRIMKDTELHIGKILGSGAFGTVHKGYWVPSLAGHEKVKIPVAIKVLRDDSSHFASTEILDEAFLMASCEHPNLVRLLGISLSQRIMLITQLMPLGNLLEYVRDNKDNIGSHHLLNWCSQIAQGMHYLSKEKHLVHRDLAARNVLVKSPNHVRITDFGLAKLLDVNEDVYRAEGGKMPIKWLALESIQRREFTHKSDVWSYGVTCWELMTFGKKPYENVPAREVHKLLERGERLLQPAICTIDVYMIMIKCWTVDVDARPTFQELMEEFSKMARDPSRYLVNKNDGELTELPSPTTSEFLRKWSDEEGGEFALQDAEQYLNPTPEELSVPTTSTTSQFSLQPAPHRAQWRQQYGRNNPTSKLPYVYGRLNTSSTDGSVSDNNRLDSAMTTMTGLPSVAGSMYPNGASTPFPSVTGKSNPGTPVIMSSMPESDITFDDERPGTSGISNHHMGLNNIRTHSDSSDVFYNPAAAGKQASFDSPWEPQSSSHPLHPGVSRAREDSATQRYSAEPALFRQHSRPNDYLDPTEFLRTPLLLENNDFFGAMNASDRSKQMMENPDYQPTFSVEADSNYPQTATNGNHVTDDGDGYEIPISMEPQQGEDAYQNIDIEHDRSSLERNGSQSGSSMSSEKRDSGLQSEGDDEQARSDKSNHIKLVPKQHNGMSAFSDENTDNTVVENPNYELLENMTTDESRDKGPEYVNEPYLNDTDRTLQNGAEPTNNNSKNLPRNCEVNEEEDDDIFITPESRRKNLPFSKNGEANGLSQGYNRTYSEPDSGVGIEIGLDNILYHRLGSTGGYEAEQQ